MKRLLSLLVVALCTAVFAQDKADRFTNGGAADGSRDPRTSYMEFVPNEIVLKFNDKVTVRRGSRVKASGVSGVDAVLQRYGVTELEKMIPLAEKPQRIRRVKNPQGHEVEVPRIDNIYRILLPANEKMPVNIHQVMEELEELEEVAYAEPNYIYSVDQLSPVGPELTAEQVARVRKRNQSTSTVVPNDPLYAEQR